MPSSFLDRPLIVTGTAGFIGFHLARDLLERGCRVVGIDCLTAYYDVRLKQDRHSLLKTYPGFTAVESDLADPDLLGPLMKDLKPGCFVHLAAQPGVRYSLENPNAYIDCNVQAFMNVLEACRHNPVGHLIYASSSSVFGDNTKTPFSEEDRTDHPISLYAATKKANEMMAHAYAHLFRIPVSGVRFFTVYGPWGRPDMAVYKFTEALWNDQPIPVYGGGALQRDFTYIDDVIESLVRLVDHPATPDPDWNGRAPHTPTSDAPYRLYNIGNHSPENVLTLISHLEQILGKKARKEDLPVQPGDVEATFADVSRLREAVGFEPRTDLYDGLNRFVEWYRDYKSGQFTIDQNLHPDADMHRP